MNPRHRREDDGGGGSAAHDGVTEQAPGTQSGATGVATQAAFGDGIVGGTDGQADAMAARQTAAQDGDPAGEAGSDHDRVVEESVSDEEIGLAAGETD